MASIDSPARRAPARRTPRPGKAAGAPGPARLGRYARAAFLIPAFVYVLFAFVVPVVYNLILSFEQTSPATIASLFAPFAGLANYRATLLQPVTQSVIVRTFIFTAGSLFFQFLIGFALALLFNLKFPLRRLARSRAVRSPLPAMMRGEDESRRLPPLKSRRVAPAAMYTSCS